MSIRIEFKCLKLENDKIEIGETIMFDNFTLLSSQIENLLLLLLPKKEKDKLKFSLENKALVISYEDTKNAVQQDMYTINFDDYLINTLRSKLQDVDCYLNFLAKGLQKQAIKYNIEHSNMPAKMQATLSKLASQSVTLTTDSNCKLYIEKTELYGNVYEEQSTSAINCRITKPELIDNCNAEFHYVSNNQNFVATLDIPCEFEEQVLHCALERLVVDIEFHYSEKINLPTKLKGVLTAFNVAIQASINKNTDDLF
ncbi:hypothetical protein PCNPT3_08265 [Psychromonas sp. CNPT3]|uniref:hypothetical protein n=1 Tax=Psychromonas sp. CNPT3 TaxID=314282 RepID=UPI0002C10C60|nr:hypothetical protein [Psychromonas sp. CNPT3]AGH81591.1 hypothetical protein PCNPT3_08265 [Psychromonas sp. CNPT3]